MSFDTVMKITGRFSTLSRMETAVREYLSEDICETTITAFPAGGAYFLRVRTNAVSFDTLGGFVCGWTAAQSAEQLRLESEA